MGFLPIHSRHIAEVDRGAQEEMPRGGASGVVSQGRVLVGVVWEIPRLGRERALRSAERRPVGREAARHRPAVRSPPPRPVPGGRRHPELWDWDKMPTKQ